MPAAWWAGFDGRRPAELMDFYLKGLTLTNAAYRAGVPVMLGTMLGTASSSPAPASMTNWVNW